MKQILAFTALVLASSACLGEGHSGTSTETENTMTARVLRVDSLREGRILPVPDVVVVRLEAIGFPFGETDPLGRDIDILGAGGRPVSFEIAHWDPSTGRARLHVRIEPVDARPGGRLVLRWRRPHADRSDPVATWEGIPGPHTLELTSALVDDFEDGDLLSSRLPVASFWYLENPLTSGLAVDVDGRSGGSLQLGCAQQACDTSRTLLAATRLASGVRSLGAMDSLVLWARGGGRLEVGLEYLDSAQLLLVEAGRIGELTPRRAAAELELDETWRRYVVMPDDLLTAPNSPGPSGWSALRDSVNFFTLAIRGGTGIWIDDIRIHGIDQEDLR